MRNTCLNRVNLAEEQVKAKFVQHKIDEDYTANIYCQGEGEPVLFTPVFDNTTFIYAAQIKHFEKKYKVITYTPRESANKPINAEVFSKDIISILELLKVKKVNVVTMCVTTSNALLAYLKRSDLFNSFFITNAFVYMPVSSFEKNLAKLLISILPDNLVKRILVKKIALPEEAEYFLPRFLEVTDFKQKFYNGVLPMINTDIRDKLSQIDLPVRILTTGQDPFIPLEYTRLIHENIKNSSFTVLENLKGHFLSLLNPDLFNNELEIHLSNVIDKMARSDYEIAY